jgi:hypothetical protein
LNFIPELFASDSGFGWHCPARDIGDEAIRQEDGRSDRRWVVMTDDGSMSALGRLADLTEEDSLLSKTPLQPKDAATGWQSRATPVIAEPPPPTFVGVRRLGRDGIAFEDVVANALERIST